MVKLNAEQPSEMYSLAKLRWGPRCFTLGDIVYLTIVPVPSLLWLSTALDIEQQPSSVEKQHGDEACAVGLFRFCSAWEPRRGPLAGVRYSTQLGLLPERTWLLCPGT